MTDTPGISTTPPRVPDSTTIGERLKRLAETFNAAFGSHRRFPLDAEQRLARGETVSIYSGTPETWTVALHVTVPQSAPDNGRDDARDVSEGNTALDYRLAVTESPLPPRMRERLMTAVTGCARRIREQALARETRVGLR